jgi:hypothetical protein
MYKILKANNIETKLVFPKKILFHNLSAKNINDRRHKLEIYLNQLSSAINLLDHPKACEFLEIDFHRRVFLSSLDFEVKVEEKIVESEENLAKSKVKRVEERKVIEFLEDLNTKPLTIANSVRAFESIYFEKNIILTKEEIEILLWGTNNLKGLLHFSGNDNKSYIAASSCMQLFGKFLKYEYNSIEADKFVEVFSRTSPEIVRKMNLINCIKGFNTLERNGFIILYYYLNLNIYGINKPEEIIKDPQSIHEYGKWLQNKANCGYLFNLSTRKSSSKTTMSESKEDLRIESSPKSFESLDEVFKESAATLDQTFNLKTQFDDFTNWDLVCSLDKVKTKVYSKGNRLLRILVQLGTSDIDSVANCMFEIKQLNKWTLCNWKKLKEESEWQDVVQVVYEVNDKEHIEYIKSRKMNYSKNGNSVFITESSVEGQAECAKRVHVNSCIKLLRRKADNGKDYIEWQTLLSAKEGFSSTIEYSICINKQAESVISMLDGLL